MANLYKDLPNLARPNLPTEETDKRIPVTLDLLNRIKNECPKSLRYNEYLDLIFDFIIEYKLNETIIEKKPIVWFPKVEQIAQ